MPRTRRSSPFSKLRHFRSRSPTADEIGRSRRATIAVLLIAAGMVLGGGGTSNPLTEVILQLVAALAFVAWALAPGQPARPVPGSLLVVALALLALPLLQLVPLPPGLWQALPGRELEREALALIGRTQSWMPLSMTPPQTLAVALALVPPLAIMLMVSALDAEGRAAVFCAIVVLGLVSALIGALQLATPFGRTLSFYEFIHRGWVIGFQASRNAEVDVLLICGLAATVLFARRAGPVPDWSRLGIYGSVMVVLLFAAIMTGSRGGIVLIPAVLVFCLLMVRRGSIAGRGTLLAVSSAMLVSVVAAWLLRDNAMLDRVANRFAADKDFRPELWTDTIFAIGQYWPFGGGMGSFVQLMTAVERLEVVDPSLPSRAHNDYLEIVLESGIIGPILIAVVAVVLALEAVRSWRMGGETRTGVQFALAAFFVVAAHSLVDYPMRSMSLAMLAGVAAGCLAGKRGDPGAKA